MAIKSIYLGVRGVLIYFEYLIDAICFRIFGIGPGDMEEEPITGKVAIVTGANTGIGKQLAKELADRGATVILGKYTY